MKFKYSFLTFIIMMEISGCGKKIEETPAAQTLTPPPQAQASKEILNKKKFNSNCVKTKFSYANIIFPSTNSTYSETDKGFNLKLFLYTTDDCIAPALIVEEAGDFLTENSQDSLETQKSPSRQVQMNFKTTTVTIKNGILASAFNQVLMCKDSHWETDVPKIILAEESDDTCLAAGSPRVKADYIRVEKSFLFFNDRFFKYQREE